MLTWLFLLLLLLLRQACAQVLRQEFDIKGVSWMGRYHSINTTSPASRALAANISLRNDVRDSFDMVEAIGDLIAQRKKENHSEACSLHPEALWVMRSTKRPQILQVGSFDNTCYSMLDLNDALKERHQVLRKGALDPRFVTDARDIILRGRRALFNALVGVPVPSDGNWTDRNGPYELTGRANRRKGQSCSMDSVFAYRKDAKWYLRAAMTNFPVDDDTLNWKRHLVQEWVPRDFGTSMQVVHPLVYTDEMQLSTTVLSMLKGRIEQSTSTANDLDDPITAVGRAYRDNLITVDIASDSVTASNIAILALPMLMSVIPVAFIADLNAVGVLLYVIVTDMFSSLPFLIKGIELVQSSSPRRQIVRAFHAGNETLGQVEVWAAECHGHVLFRNLGILFIVVALAAAVLGLSLECWAITIMRRRRDALPDGHQLQGPFGSVLSLRPQFETGDFVFADLDDADRKALRAGNLFSTGPDGYVLGAAQMGDVARGRRQTVVRRGLFRGLWLSFSCRGQDPAASGDAVVGDGEQPTEGKVD